MMPHVEGGSVANVRFLLPVVLHDAVAEASTIGKSMGEVRRC